MTDNGDGTMTAKAELKSRNGEDAKDTIVFKNSYTAQLASVTLGASKAYVGGELKDGQFTFELIRMAKSYLKQRIQKKVRSYLRQSLTIRQVLTSTRFLR